MPYAPDPSVERETSGPVGAPQEYVGRRRRPAVPTPAELDTGALAAVVQRALPVEPVQPVQRVEPAQPAPGALRAPARAAHRAPGPAAGSAGPLTRVERRRLEAEQAARAAADRSARRTAGARRSLVGAVGAVTAVGIAAGAVVVSQLLPRSAGPAVPAAHGAASAAAGTEVDDAPVDTAVLAAARVPRVSRGAELRMTPITATDTSVKTSGCTGTAPAEHFANGRIPLSALCALPFAKGHRLRSDAAVAIIRLDGAYRDRFKTHLCLTDSYRSLASQQSLAYRKPALAARPGTSNHGWGLAVDLCKGPDDPSSTQYAWMRDHAPAFGWDNPAWARPGGSSRTEPWHWEFVTGEDAAQR